MATHYTIRFPAGLTCSVTGRTYYRLRITYDTFSGKYTSALLEQGEVAPLDYSRVMSGTTRHVAEDTYINFESVPSPYPVDVPDTWEEMTPEVIQALKDVLPPQ